MAWRYLGRWDFRTLSNCYGGHVVLTTILLLQKFPFPSPPLPTYFRLVPSRFWPLGREVYIARDTRKWHAVCLQTYWSFLSDVCGAIFSKSTRLVMNSGSRLIRSYISDIFVSDNMYRCPFADLVSLSSKCPLQTTVTKAIVFLKCHILSSDRRPGFYSQLIDR